MASCVYDYPHSELALIPSGVDGVRATLAKMVSLAREYRRHPLIRELAEEVIEHVPARDRPGNVRALWQFVRRFIKYVPDIRNVETLHTPIRLLKNRAGDCDDQALLLAALLESVGQGTRFVAMGFQRGRYSHVLAETWLGGGWVPLETTVERPFGWNPPGQVERLVLHV